MLHHMLAIIFVWCWQGQESLGRRVSELQIDSSPHVQHMRHHKELYCQALTSFLSELQLPKKGKFNQACPYMPLSEKDGGPIYS